MRISDWSSDVCSSDLTGVLRRQRPMTEPHAARVAIERYHLAFHADGVADPRRVWKHGVLRSEEHTSELQSLMRISYAVFCLKKKNKQRNHRNQKKIDTSEAIY